MSSAGVRSRRCHALRYASAGGGRGEFPDQVPPSSPTASLVVPRPVLRLFSASPRPRCTHSFLSLPCRPPGTRAPRRALINRSPKAERKVSPPSAVPLHCSQRCRTGNEETRTQGDKGRCKKPPGPHVAFFALKLEIERHSGRSGSGFTPGGPLGNLRFSA
ncbi:uncharacterized protein LOC135107371 isoform X3 [Scylla paramamosain]|uniref:uncharacterized protein LOC135107371 isoform X3 n=1 Tax=Scylla paramamosain TaxID=85552 RepID=UPI0030839044